MAPMDEARAQALVSIRVARADCESARETALAQVKELDAQLRQLATAERALDPKMADKPRETSVDRTRTIMSQLGTATQAQVAKKLGQPKNTAKHALGVLTAEGFVKPTERLVNRSPEFTIVAA